MLSSSPLATRTHRALRKGVIVGSAVVVGMLLVELSRELFGQGDISLLAYLLYPGVALVQAVPGWDLFIGHSVIPGLFVDLFLYSAGATLWFVARAHWSTQYEEASSTRASREAERITLGSSTKFVAFFLTLVAIAAFALPYILRTTVRPLAEIEDLRFHRSEQPKWRECSQSAPIVVIGTVTDTSEGWWPTFVRTDEGAVRDFRRRWIELSVEHRLRGSALPERLGFYQWVELSQSHQKLLLDLHQPFSDSLGSSAFGKGRYILFLAKENGTYRVHLDITETGFRVRSGMHDTLPGSIESLEHLLAGILLTPAPGHHETEFAENLEGSFAIAHALIGEDEGGKYLEALLEHPSAAVRSEACLAARYLDRAFLETCLAKLLNGPPEYQRRVQAILDGPQR
ncbi:MAG: hypothetical protein O2968_12160 [Acidobacteria bacterium]|nr:hypothetical protein [Acidobacteriota bacterium]